MIGEAIFFIHRTIVYQNLLYCFSIWGFTNKVHLSQVFVNQKELVKIIAGVHFREHTSTVFNNLQLCKLSSCSMYMCSIFVCRVLIKTSDNELFHYQNAMYATRNFSSRKLLTSFVRNSSSRNSTCDIGPKHWNSLPERRERVKSVMSYTSFKRQLKRYILSIQRWFIK